MTIIEQRDQAVTETVGRVRLIEQQHGVNYDALGKIRDELIDLTRNKEMFPRSSFPITEDGGSAVYRISEDSNAKAKAASPERLPSIDVGLPQADKLYQISIISQL